MTVWGDTPLKVYNDIQAARAAAKALPNPARQTEAGRGSVKPPVKPAVVQTARPDAAPGRRASVQARRDGRALGRTAPSRTPRTPRRRGPAGQGPQGDGRRRLRSSPQTHRSGSGAEAAIWQWSEDNPDKLQAERRPRRGADQPGLVAVKNKEMTPADAKAKAVALLKQGRTQLAENKLDDAVPDVGQLRAIPGVRWGLFEDSPEKLRQDVEAARQKQDQDESVKPLAEARKLMQQGPTPKPNAPPTAPETARPLQRLGLRRPTEQGAGRHRGGARSRTRACRRSRRRRPSP